MASLMPEKLCLVVFLGTSYFICLHFSPCDLEPTLSFLCIAPPGRVLLGLGLRSPKGIRWVIWRTLKTWHPILLLPPHAFPLLEALEIYKMSLQKPSDWHLISSRRLLIDCSKWPQSCSLGRIFSHAVSEAVVLGLNIFTVKMCIIGMFSLLILCVYMYIQQIYIEPCFVQDTLPRSWRWR